MLQGGVWWLLSYWMVSSVSGEVLDLTEILSLPAKLPALPYAYDALEPFIGLESHLVCRVLIRPPSLTQMRRR